MKLNRREELERKENNAQDMACEKEGWLTHRIEMLLLGMRTSYLNFNFMPLTTYFRCLLSPLHSRLQMLMIIRRFSRRRCIRDALFVGRSGKYASDDTLSIRYVHLAHWVLTMLSFLWRHVLIRRDGYGDDERLTLCWQ